MAIGAPPPASESREPKPLFAPPRSAVPLPGAPAAFGRGFVRRLRDSGVGCAFLFLFVLAGGMILFGLAGTVGPWKEGLRENGDPRFFLVMMAFGVVFFLVPLRMLQVTLTGTEHRRRRGRGASARHPWTADYPWQPEGMAPDYSAAGGGKVLGPLAFLALIGLFNIGLGSGSWIAWAVILALDLLGLAILVDVVLRVVQALRRAGPAMRWPTFPAFLGDRLEGVFTTRRALTSAGPVRATLRCVRDQWTTSEATEGRDHNELKPHVLYTQTFEVPAAARFRELPLAFDLPADLPGTDLLREEATYWQVVLAVPLTGPDFDVIFLAPVYERRE